MTALLALVTLHAAGALFGPVTLLVALETGASLLVGVSGLVVTAVASVAVVSIAVAGVSAVRLVTTLISGGGFRAVARNVTRLVTVVTASVRGGSLIVSVATLISGRGFRAVARDMA